MEEFASSPKIYFLQFVRGRRLNFGHLSGRGSGPSSVMSEGFTSTMMGVFSDISTRNVGAEFNGNPVWVKRIDGVNESVVNNL